MTSPTKELQGAIYNRLRLDANIIAAVGSNISADQRRPTAFPSINISGKTLLAENSECLTNNQITQQIDVWSREPDMAVDEISELVRVALLSPDLTLAVNAIATFEFRETFYLNDPDGLTDHAAMYFDAMVEQP
jgi:hypothetical protein